MDLLDEYGSQVKLGEAIDTNPKYISQIKNKYLYKGKERSVGNDLARKIEVNLGKPKGWFDQHKVTDEENIGASTLMEQTVRTSDIDKFCLRLKEDYHAPADSVLKAIDALLAIRLEDDVQQRINKEWIKINHQKKLMKEKEVFNNSKEKELLLKEETLNNNRELCRKETSVIFDSAIANAMRSIDDKIMSIKIKQSIVDNIARFYELYKSNGNLFKNNSLSSADNKSDWF